MNYLEFKDYFENLAKTNKLIRHSDTDVAFVTDWNQEVESLWSSKKSPVMVLNLGTGFFRVEDIELVDMHRCGFEIHVPIDGKKSNKSAVHAAADMAEKIGKQIILKMRYDGENYESCPRVIGAFDPSKVLYQHFESKLPNFMTCVFSFELNGENYEQYDASQWL